MCNGTAFVTYCPAFVKTVGKCERKRKRIEKFVVNWKGAIQSSCIEKIDASVQFLHYEINIRFPVRYDRLSCSTCYEKFLKDVTHRNRRLYIFLRISATPNNVLPPRLPVQRTFPLFRGPVSLYVSDRSSFLKSCTCSKEKLNLSGTSHN